ncbi:MAG: hypothetical protein D6E12_14540 [Desulfovibrio sp.]|nr:MAG: hypothetical protein D6E12_14540 [Desulfovibrio sp.]
MAGIFRNFFKIIDHQTVIIAALTVGGTYLCLRFGITADMPTGIIGIAIIFPIVFSINAAYRRREDALKSFASLKAHAASLYFAHRDWAPKDVSGRDKLGLKELPTTLLHRVRDYLSAVEDNVDKLKDVYEVFSRYSKENEIMRDLGVPANEISRVNQYVRAMIIDFERMRNIHLYRTPMSLRAYSCIFLNIFPILFAPYFAFLIQDTMPVVGYALAVLYSVILVSLDNIQQVLEDPFDAGGEHVDDLNLDVADRYVGLL